jgi:hypothetical protein
MQHDSAVDIMRVMSYTARYASTLTALLLIGISCAAPLRVETPTADSRGPQSVRKAQDPPVLTTIAAAHWRVANARAALPPVQCVQDEALEIQDFIQYAFDGGALRLCVSPGSNGGDIFALLVDTREPQYRDFAGLASTNRYATYHHDAYVVVVPLRPVTQGLFDTLKARQWTEEELEQQLGAPSYHWHVHGIGYMGLTHVSEGLSFIGDQRGPHTPVMYQVYAPDIEAERAKEHDYDLPPLASLSHLDYAKGQRECREDFANALLSQREQIDGALAEGKRSPDGRFIVGHVNLGGTFNTERVVIRELGKPERRYAVPHFTYDKDYLWLNARTILFKVYTIEQEFYTIDALTGAMQRVATVPYEPPYEQRVLDFGISGSKRFWYKTADGKTHEVTVRNLHPQLPQ